MNRKELAKQAFEECCDKNNVIHPGKMGCAPFWNIESKQFMYVPAFHFTYIPGCSKYRYDAVDEKGICHSFEACGCLEDLSPIWKDIPEGVVKLTVTAINPDGSDYSLVGARTFFKLASFPEITPAAVSSYRDSATRGYEYAMKQPFIQYWLKYGKPDPSYDLNTYPSKIISSLVNAMIDYSKLCPEVAPEAMKIAVTAADWMMGITPRGNSPLADLPPTYYFDFCPDPEKYGIKTPNYANAVAYRGTLMMIYPAYAGIMYLNLGKVTGDSKYIEEALKIGHWYLEHVEENGSWFLVRSEETGEPTASNYVAPAESMIPFLTDLYDYTGDEKWKKLCDGAVSYVERTQYTDYDWEGQFEDIGLSSRYYNLSQYGPVALATYYVKYRKDQPEYVERAKELMRFAEDQFVVWNRFSPWVWPSATSLEDDGSAPKRHSPCGQEQYRCYWPIDGSTSHMAKGFLAMYEAGLGEIYLAKARVLVDQFTRVQFENGQIPTFWIDTPGDRANFWFNCHFASCNALILFTKYENYKFQ